MQLADKKFVFFLKNYPQIEFTFYFVVKDRLMWTSVGGGFVHVYIGGLFLLSWKVPTSRGTASTRQTSPR